MRPISPRMTSKWSSYFCADPKDLFLCFRANGPSVRIAWTNGPGDCESPVPKPQSGRPFNGDESNCRPVGPLSMIKTLVRRAAENELPAARDCRSDEDIVFGESFGAFESFVEFHHLLLWNDDSNRVITVELHDGGMLSLPCHALGVGFDGDPACQQHTVPFLLQR